MARTPYLLQTGMGVDLHGSDATTAARRAVEQAIRHNSLLFLGALGLRSAAQIHVAVTVAAPHHERIDTDAVASALPVGTVTVETREGGLQVETGLSGDPALIAVAAVLVSVDDGAA